jgi:hypothetical protein
MGKVGKERSETQAGPPKEGGRFPQEVGTEAAPNQEGVQGILLFKGSLVLLTVFSGFHPGECNICPPQLKAYS